MTPKSFKFSKFQKGRLSPNYILNQSISFGQYGLLALEPSRIKNNTIVSLEKVVKRILKPNGKLWIRIYPHFPVTSKPIEVRMGKGKGTLDYWTAKVRAGQILLEFTCSSSILAKKIHKLVNSKLPIKIKLISKS